jgi:predicted SprT family Zn-dependent metalloprotease
MARRELVSICGCRCHGIIPASRPESPNPVRSLRAGHIRLNTELVKKPKDLLEYVIVHEMAHLLEPTHSDRFIAILAKHYPTWREARAELNELPLTAEVWQE